MPERPNGTASKAEGLVKDTGVRIPLLPPVTFLQESIHDTQVCFPVGNVQTVALRSRGLSGNTAGQQSKASGMR